MRRSYRSIFRRKALRADRSDVHAPASDKQTATGESDPDRPVGRLQSMSRISAHNGHSPFSEAAAGETSMLWTVSHVAPQRSAPRNRPFASEVRHSRATHLIRTLPRRLSVGGAWLGHSWSQCTLKSVSTAAPNALLIATSAASRPYAIKTRPIRGALFRGSNVCQLPPT